MFLHSNDIELERSVIYGKMKAWLGFNSDASPEAEILALAELIQEKLDNMEATDAFKGGIVSALIVDLSEQNKVYLAINRMLRESLIERKTKTVH